MLEARAQQSYLGMLQMKGFCEGEHSSLIIGNVTNEKRFVKENISVLLWGMLPMKAFCEGEHSFPRKCVLILKVSNCRLFRNY